MPQEDITPPVLPDLLVLLYELQVRGFSAHVEIATEELRVIPAPDERLIAKIKEHYEELLYLQPGVCDQCQTWNIRRHDAYWGATPLYCALCLLKIVKVFEKHDRWPDVHFEFAVPDRENNEENPTQTHDTPESDF